MKVLFVLFALSLAPANARLPELDAPREWLGYFVGWIGRSADFGIGADGDSALFPKDGKEHLGHKEVGVRYVIEEKVKGKWVRRQFLKEGGVASESKGGLDPEDPVVLVTTVTGDTQVEWTHVVNRGKVSVKPRLLGKKTKNEIRVGMEFALPRLYRFDEIPEERELKDKVGKDFLKATRLKDDKSVKVKFHEVEEDILSEDYLAEGASEIEVQSKALKGLSVMIENGGDDAGRIDVQPRGPLFQSFRMTWMADMEHLGEKESFVTFWVE